jgi:hypothetical protein
MDAIRIGHGRIVAWKVGGEIGEGVGEKRGAEV